MRTLFANLAHGNEPYILAANIGNALGDVVIPLIYPDRQEKILREWVGNSKHVYLDRGSGDILSRIIFHGNYQDYINRILREGKSVKAELTEYLKDFEAISLAGEKKRFKQPKIELNIGSPLSLEKTKSFYIFPGLISEYAANSPVNVEGLKDFITLAKDTEEKHKMIFIPEINSFSYKRRGRGKKEVSTPPLKRKGYNNDPIERGILVTLPGSLVYKDELCRAAEKTRKIYHLAGDDLPGEPLPAHTTHEIFFNPNIVAVLAKAGWGTLWLCQVGEKPIIAPAWRETDDLETYHNNQTVEALGLGIIYKEFTEDLIQQAITKVDRIKQLNRELYEMFGHFTWDGISFVQEEIKEYI